MSIQFSIPSQPGIQFGRRARASEIEGIRSLTQEKFGPYAKPVNPKTSYIDPAGIPGLSFLAGKVKDVVRGIRLGIMAVKNGGSITMSGIGDYRNEKQLQSALKRWMKSADDYAINAEKGLYHFKKSGADMLIATLAPNKAVYQMYFNHYNRSKQVPTDSPALQQPENKPEPQKPGKEYNSLL